MPNKCNCPFCGNEVKADGSANDLLINGIIRLYSEMQQNKQYNSTTNPLPCPRCGRPLMSTNPMKNALSRHADIQVCDMCGNDEAMMIVAGAPVPIFDWWIVREIFTQ